MKPEEIDQVSAGPELDALIAEKVMGIEVSDFDGQKRVRDHDPVYGLDTKVYKFPERYSTEIAAAWLVVEKLNLFRTSTLSTRSGIDTEWGWCLEQRLDGQWVIKHRFGMDIVRAETAPLAICRAALKAIGEKE